MTKNKGTDWRPMLVQDIMTKNVVAIDPDMPITDVNTLMEQRNIRHFPIVEKGQLIGIVSDRDIRVVGSEHPKAQKGVTIKDAVQCIMKSPVLTAHPLDPIEEAAKVLRENKIGAMPVVNNDELVGIVTGIDFLEAMVKMTGVYGATTRLEVEVDNRPGALAGLLDSIAKKKVNVSSVMTTRSDPDAVNFVLRVSTIDGRGLSRKLRKEGFEILWPTEKL
ncbi:MAG: CBS and ACT domain-containing protein [Trueperaceae bacterium]